MATALKLRSDIKKLKKGLEAKGVSASVKEKLKSQLQKAENELASLKKTGKAPKKSSVAGTKVALTALQKLIQKKKYGVYQGAGVDLKKDAGEGALATGRRESKGLKSNQHGDKSDNKGNVYYEYRPNRLDVKQPKKRQSYPKLEDGGMMAKGGKLEAGVYRVGKPNKVSPILYEQKIVEIFENGDIATASDYGRKLTDFKVQSYPIITTEQLEAQYKMEKGGYMADGGDTKPKFGYIAMYKGKQIELYANSKYEAQVKAAKIFNAKKDYDVSVYLAEVDGKPYMNTMMAEGGIAEGYHQMPDGSIMADSAHMAKGGGINYDLYGNKSMEYLEGEIAHTERSARQFRQSGDEESAKDREAHAKKLWEIYYGKREQSKMASGGYMADGGEVKVGDILTATTGVKVKVIEYDPKFGGRVRVERMDEYATGKPSQYMPLSKFKMASGGYMAKGGDLNSIKQQYLQNEDENAHSENVVLLAKHFGTDADIAEAKRILALHEKEGHLSSENGKKRQQLHLKLIDKATKEMAKQGIEFEKGGYMAKGGRVAKDFNGRISKETWGKHDLSKMYENNLDLIADVVDYVHDLQKDVSQSYAKEFVYDLMNTLKEGKITYNDGSSLKFEEGGVMSTTHRMSN